MDQIFDPLETTAKRFPASVALASRAGFMNYGTLLRHVASARQMAVRSGIRAGHVVVLAVSNPDMLLVLALALMRLGCRIGMNPNLKVFAAGGLDVDVVIVDSKDPPKLRMPVIRLSGDWFKGRQGRALSLPPAAPDYSVVSASSGSTGRPKLIEVTHQHLQRWVSNRLSLFNPIPGARCLPVLGDGVGGTFKEQLAMLANGGSIVRSVDREPVSILDTIEIFRPDYLTIAPWTLIKVLRSLRESPRKLGKVRLLRTSGAYCAPEIQNAALASLAEEVVSNYGSTEVGWIAAGSAVETQKVKRSVGRICEDVEVAAFGEAGNRLPPGSEGEIRARSPEGTMGVYVGRDLERRKDTFVDGWFVTGDVGMVDDNRNLIIHGRTPNIINIGGAKVSAEVVEEQILSFGEVDDVGVTAIALPTGFELICAAVAGKSTLTLDDINGHLRKCGAEHLAHAVKNVPAIPRTGNNKIDRLALKQLCADVAVPRL